LINSPHCFLQHDFATVNRPKTSAAGMYRIIVLVKFRLAMTMDKYEFLVMLMNGNRHKMIQVNRTAS
jgi:hypothetical protein